MKGTGWFTALKRSVSFHAGCGFFNSSLQLLHCPRDLLLCNDGWGCNQQVVTGIAIHATLDGIRQKPTPEGRLGHSTGEVHFRREWLFADLVGNKLNACEQAHATYVADEGHLHQDLKIAQRSAVRSGRSLDQFLLANSMQHRQPRSN